jgi:predicted membrane protein
MKDVTIQIPKEQNKLTIYQKIKLTLNDKTMTANQIYAKIKDIDLYTVRTKISNLVQIGDLEVIKCPHCDVGKMYRKKK